MPPNDRGPWPADRIGRVARHVDLIDVRLATCSVRWLSDAEEFDPAGYASRWAVHPHSETGPVAPEDEDVSIGGGLLVRVTFNYFHKPGDESEEEEGGEGDGGSSAGGEGDGDEPADILAAFYLTYRAKSGSETATLDGSDIAAFAQFNSTFNSWPYWRELVQSMLGRMGLPVVTVPLLQVPDLTRPSGSRSD